MNNYDFDELDNGFNVLDPHGGEPENDAASVNNEPVAQDDPRAPEENARETNYRKALDGLTVRVRNMFDALYSDAEKNTLNFVGRKNLVSVDGVCLETLLRREYSALPENSRPLGSDGKAVDSDTYVSLRAEEYTARAYLAGKNVQYFVADPITGKASEAFHLRMRTEPADFGLTADEYEAASARAAELAGPSGSDPRRNALSADRLRALNLVQRRNMLELDSPVQKSLFFGEWEKTNGMPSERVKSNVGRIGRTSGVSLAMAAMACDGYRVADILDPTKLTEEKKRYGEKVIDRCQKNDAQWVAMMNRYGADAIANYFESIVKGTDLSGSSPILSDDTVNAAIAANVLFDLFQDDKLVKAEVNKWYEENRGLKDAKAFAEEYINRTGNLPGAFRRIVNGEQEAIRAQNGYGANLTASLDGKYLRTILNERRAEKAAQKDWELVSNEDIARSVAFAFLADSNPQFIEDYSNRMTTDSEKLSDEILSGEFWKRNELYPEKDEQGFDKIALRVHPTLGVVSDGENIPGAARKSAPSQLEEITEEYEDMEEHVKGYEAGEITPETRLEDIRAFNKDRIAAGLNPMTEEEMIAFANDNAAIDDYRLCKEPGRQLRVYENGNKLPYKVPTCFDRSKGYIFSFDGTEEAHRRNLDLEAKLATPEGKREYIRGLYDYMMNLDESSVFVKTLDEKVDFYKTDMQYKQMLFEAKYILTNDNAKDQFLTQEEIDAADDRFGIVYYPNGYEPMIRMKGSPYSLIMPEMSAEELAQLTVFYTDTKQTEKLEYVKSCLKAFQDYEFDKYSPFTADIMKENGFLDPGASSARYESYDDKGKLLKSRASAMSALSEGSAKSVRFVRTETDENGIKTRKELTVTRDEVITAYNRFNLDQLVKKAYVGHPVPVFSENPLINEAAKAALLYRLEDRFFTNLTDPKEREDKYNTIVDEIRSGKDRFFAYMSGKDYVTMNNLINSLLSPNAKDKMFVSDLATDIYAEKRSIQSANDLAKAYIDGMFAPKTDPSGMRFEFEKSQRVPLIDETQKQADAIVLDVPEGLDERNVAAVVMSCLLTSENMAESYNKAKNMNGSTMKNWDAADAGFGNFVQNTLEGDVRFNMHLPRLMLPEARAEAATLLGEFKNGEYDNVARKASVCFRNLIENYRSFADPADSHSLKAGELVSYVADLLDKPGIRERVSMSGEDRATVDYIKTNLRLVREMKSLHSDIVERLHKNVLTLRYPDGTRTVSPGYVKGEDPEFDNMLREYKARVMFFDKVKESRNVYKDAVAAKYGISGEDHVRAMQNQPLSRAQRNMAEDPEAYLDFLRAEADKNTVIEEFLATSWEKGKNDFKIHEKLISRKCTDNVTYSEQWKLPSAINEAFSAIPKDEPEPKLERIFKDLPFTKDTDVTLDLTADEMTRRCTAYQKALEDLRKLSPVYGQLPNQFFIEGQDNESERYETVSVTEKLEKALTDEIELLQDAIPNAVSETAYERASGERKAARVNNEDFSAIEKRAADAKAAAETEGARFGDDLFGHASKSTYRAMIANLASKTATVSDRELRDVMNRVAVSIGKPYEKVVLSEAYEKLGEIQERFNDRLVDSDDPVLLSELGIAVNLASRIDAFNEAGELRPEAIAENSPYMTAYEKAGVLADRIDRIMNGTDAARINSETPEYWKLLQCAKGSAENIRSAVAEEALGNTERGIDSLKKSDDLAVLTVFSVISTSKKDHAIRDLLESSGCLAFISSADRSPEIKAQKSSLDIAKLADTFSNRGGFGKLLTAKDEVKHTADHVSEKDSHTLGDDVPEESPRDLGNSF